MTKPIFKKISIDKVDSLKNDIIFKIKGINVYTGNGTNADLDLVYNQTKNEFQEIQVGSHHCGGSHYKKDINYLKWDDETKEKVISLYEGILKNGQSCGYIDDISSSIKLVEDKGTEYSSQL